MDAQPTIADEVERYLRTGETDPHLAAWSGGFSGRGLDAPGRGSHTNDI